MIRCSLEEIWWVFVEEFGLLLGALALQKW